MQSRGFNYSNHGQHALPLIYRSPKQLYSISKYLTVPGHGSPSKCTLEAVTLHLWVPLHL